MVTRNGPTSDNRVLMVQGIHLHPQVGADVNVSKYPFCGRAVSASNQCIRNASLHRLPVPRPNCMCVACPSRWPERSKQMHSDAVEAQALRQPGAHVPINAYRVATRALMYGSVLSIGCTSAGVLAVGYFMGVRNVRTNLTE